jgi:hypothetical protein
MINLKENTIDLKLTPAPEKAQLLSLEVPIGIGGTLKEPAISMGALPVVSTLARMTKNTVLFPIKRIAGEALPEDGSDVCPCKGGYKPPEEPAEGVIPKGEATDEDNKKARPRKRGIFNRD